MSDSLLDFSGLEPSKLKRKQGRYQKKKSFVKFFNTTKTTKPERDVHALLQELKIPFTTQYKLEKKYYDVKIDSMNILLEIDGLYWHGIDVEYDKKNKMQKKAFKNDVLKDGLASKYGYIIKRIREDEITMKRLKEILGL